MLFRAVILCLACVALAPRRAGAQTDSLSIHVRHGALCDAVVSLAQLQQLTPRSATITAHDGTKATYEGAWLRDVLDLGCPSIAAIEKREMVRSAVRVSASDKYSALVALTEADSSFRAQPIVLAWSRDGKTLEDHDGPFQLIVPDDLRHARDVRKVIELEVITP